MAKNRPRRPSTLDMSDWASMADAKIIPPMPSTPKVRKPVASDDEFDDADEEAAEDEKEKYSGSDASQEEDEKHVDPSLLAKTCGCGHAFAGNITRCRHCGEKRLPALSPPGSPLAMTKTRSPSEILYEMEKARQLVMRPGSVGIHFDKRGVLGEQSAMHWALAAGDTRPRHRSAASKNDSKVGVGRRQKLQNAKASFEEDHARRLQIIKRANKERTTFDDVQTQRFLKLMFDPIEDLSCVLQDEVLDETLDKYFARLVKEEKKAKALERWKLAKRGQLTMRLFQAKKVKKADADGEADADADEKTAPEPQGSSGILANDHRVLLLSVFQRYVFRVSSPTSSLDHMSRASWFRFLHHCGILGPDASEINSASSAAKSSRLSHRGASVVPTPWSPSQGHHRTVASTEAGLDFLRKGGVSFSHGSAVFGMYAEVNPTGFGPSALTFASWVSAIQHILRGPSFYRDPKEMVANLFGVCLCRCDHIMGITHPTPGRTAQTIPRSRQTSSSNPRSMDNFHRKSGVGRPEMQGPPQKGHVNDPATSGNGDQFTAIVEKIGNQAKEKEQAAAVGVLGWHSDRAEEEMCEPEVLVLLHEYEAPLRSIFKLYAKRWHKMSPKRSHKPNAVLVPRDLSRFGTKDADIAEDPALPAGFVLPDESITQDVIPLSGSEDVSEDDEDEFPTMDAMEGLQLIAQEDDCEGMCPYKAGDVQMLPSSFLAMIRDFGFFPNIVQHHSLRQHLEITLNRRKAVKLNYEAFIECLLRISFVYLSIYGNNVQQACSAKGKCVWLLTFLQSRYKLLGLSRRMSAVNRGEHVDGSGHDWVKKPVNVDTMPLNDLVLWEAMDAHVAPRRKVVMECTATRPSFLSACA